MRFDRRFVLDCGKRGEGPARSFSSELTFNLGHMGTPNLSKPTPISNQLTSCFSIYCTSSGDMRQRVPLFNGEEENFLHSGIVGNPFESNERSTSILLDPVRSLTLYKIIYINSIAWKYILHVSVRSRSDTLRGVHCFLVHGSFQSYVLYS